MKKLTTNFLPVLGAVALLAPLAAGIARAQVPPDIEAKLKAIGQIVDPACTAKLYRPLMPANDVTSKVTPLYPGISIARDVSFGPDPKDVVDVFSADKGGANRTVVMYVPGGGGNKTEQQDKEANAFYDNIGRWGTKNGMVVVLMQRHPHAGFDGTAKDVSAAIQWIQANISKYKGNPDRIFTWAQSAGNGPLGTYLGRPEVWGPKGVGIKGSIMMSGQWNVAPLEIPGAGNGGGRGPGGPGGGFPAAGSTCGAGGPGAGDGAIPGPSGMTPTEAGAGRGGRGRRGSRGGGRGPVDPAVLLQESTLPTYKTTNVKFLFMSAELDPGISGQMSPFYQTLHDEMCKSGPNHCPQMQFEKGESHMSEVFSIDSPDKSVSNVVLAFIKKTK